MRTRKDFGLKWDGILLKPEKWGLDFGRMQDSVKKLTQNNGLCVLFKVTTNMFTKMCLFFHFKFKYTALCTLA